MCTGIKFRSLSQESVFNNIAKEVTESCIQGYNGTIFAYGQTGSGKTYTMLGPIVEDDFSLNENRGLIPRSIEFLFNRIQQDENFVPLFYDLGHCKPNISDQMLVY